MYKSNQCVKPHVMTPTSKDAEAAEMDNYSCPSGKKIFLHMLHVVNTQNSELFYNEMRFCYKYISIFPFIFL